MPQLDLHRPWREPSGRCLYPEYVHTQERSLQSLTAIVLLHRQENVQQRSDLYFFGASRDRIRRYIRRSPLDNNMARNVGHIDPRSLLPLLHTRLPARQYHTKQVPS